MNPVEQALAAITVAVCVMLLVRLCLGAARQQRFDRVLREFGETLRGGAQRLWHRRASQRAARAEAEAAIQRARGGKRPGRGAEGAAGDDGEWTGNVYTPKSFRKPKRPDKLH